MPMSSAPIVRLAYRVCFAVACVSGAGAARCAAAFRAVGSRSGDYGPVVVVAQLPLLVAWGAARGLFLLSSAPCFAIGRSRAF